jgi:hypothetical protein
MNRRKTPRINLVPNYTMSPVQGVLPTAYRITKLKRGQGPTRALEPLMGDGVIIPSSRDSPWCSLRMGLGEPSNRSPYWRKENFTLKGIELPSLS